MSWPLFLATLNYINGSTYKSHKQHFVNTEELLSRLKFITHIEKNEKVDTYYMSRQPNNLTTKILRTFIYNDNRSNLKNFLKDTIQRAVSLIITSEDKIDLQTLIFKDLIKSKNGILNIKDTYSHDSNFTCQIDVLLDDLQIKLNSLKLKYNHLAKQENEEEQEGIHF